MSWIQLHGQAEPDSEQYRTQQAFEDYIQLCVKGCKTPLALWQFCQIHDINAAMNPPVLGHRRAPSLLQMDKGGVRAWIEESYTGVGKSPVDVDQWDPR